MDKFWVQYVTEDPHVQAFPVYVDKDATIYDLKTAIKDIENSRNINKSLTCSENDITIYASPDDKKPLSPGTPLSKTGNTDDAPYYYKGLLVFACYVLLLL